MKTNLSITKRLAVLTLSIISLQLSTLFAQGTAFTYQGQLQNNGSPASGTYNLTFTLFNTNTTGVPVAGPVTNSAVSVTNGLFMVLIDFGPGVFTGATNWLEIGVATSGGSTFTTLAPRQQLTPTPYAISAESAGVLSGTLSASQLTSIGNTNGGTGNFFVGSSGNATTSGIYNTANGDYALSANTSGNFNTANGGYALSSNTNGYDNTASGYQALFNNTSGYNNTADGVQALFFNTSGFYNTAYGASALQDNTTGSYNTANGAAALYFNTTGSGNTANGESALYSNTSGSGNTANGVQALVNNTSGNFNTANGDGALSSNNGYDNTANGFNALVNNASGNYNTADGGAALYSSTSGSYNIALGYQAGYNVTTGSSNIDIGNQGLSTDTNIIRIGSGQSQTFIAGVINGDGSGLTGLNISAAQLTSIGNTNGGINNFFVGPSGNSTMSGSGNTANGNYALYSDTSGSDNTADGLGALNLDTSGSDNTANGAAALTSNTSGNNNTANGYKALIFNTSGNNNTANGFDALISNTSGSNNIALGYQAGYYITTGSFNIDIGNQGLSTDTNIIRIGSGQSQTFIAGVINGDGGGLTGLNASQLTSPGNTNGGSGNFFVGPSGNSTTSGGGNTALGLNALFFNTNGNWNTANGAGALQFNTSGSGNTANGLLALAGNTSGNNNTANGFQALFDNTRGTNNTANGYQALSSNTTGFDNTADGAQALYYSTTGSNNIALGYQAGYNITGSSNIDIGNAGLSTDINIIRIGTTQTATYLAGTVYANGVALTSDRNAKENFTAVNPREVLAKVASLPVTEWNYKTDSKDVQHIGPMAQDFQAAFGLDGTDDKHISVVDEGGVALAAIQGLNQRVEEQQKQLNQKECEITELKHRLEALETVIRNQKPD